MWYLVKIPCWNAPYWLQDFDDQFWSNINGGRTPKSEEDAIYEIAENDYYDLDHTKTGLVVKHSDTGWLNRAGRFYPCRYYEHDLYAHLILRQEVKKLERCGWVRIKDQEWISTRRLSAEQLNWLSYHGYKVDDYDDIKPWLDRG